MNVVISLGVIALYIVTSELVLTIRRSLHVHYVDSTPTLVRVASEGFDGGALEDARDIFGEIYQPIEEPGNDGAWIEPWFWEPTPESVHTLRITVSYPREAQS